MPTSNTRLITVTDDDGKPLLPTDDLFEPLPGSIALTQGRFGTAWQRHFSDGLWYPANGRKTNGRGWAEMIQSRQLVIVYDCDERTAENGG